MLKYLPMLLLGAAAGCGEQYRPANLYMATTPDCRNWSEGSRFDLPEGMRAFASMPSPTPPGTAPLDLALTYFVPRGRDAKFSTREFALTVPHGAVASRGIITSVLVKESSSATNKADLLEKLPMLLRSAASVEETSFRVNLRFGGALPERFDLTPPPMVIGGTSYPVRTYTYRLFKERNAYGLCS